MTEQEWIDIFGDNLIDMLRDANMTQKDLADETGLAESTISAYIHKRKAPSFRAIVNISYALNVSMDDLIDFGDKIL